MFLRNYWYVAASDDEVRERPLGRTILGEPVVLFRAGNGALHAFEDRCPHRRLPLSMGKVIGDALQCHYHGLRFDGSGKCVRVPGQDHIPQNARVRTYPVIERYRWIWIWMGDPALADPAQICDFHWLADSGLGRQALISSCRGQLAACRRQSPRSHASRFRSRNHDRQYGVGRARGSQSPARAEQCAW